MKTDYKYIRFEQRMNVPGQPELHNGKPMYAIVNKKAGNELGQVFWYPSWRQWVARFDEDAVWSHDCLADVREFIFMMPIHQSAEAR